MDDVNVSCPSTVSAPVVVLIGLPIVSQVSYLGKYVK